MKPRVPARQALLHPDAGPRYPGIPAGVWIPAEAMTDRVYCLRLLHGQSPVHWTERVLDPKHFDFLHGPAVGKDVTRAGRRRTDSA